MRLRWIGVAVLAAVGLRADVKVVCDRTNAVYAVGERIVFSAVADGPEERGAELRMRVCRFGGEVLAETNGADRLSLSVVGDKPGFLHCTVVPVDTNLVFSAQWGVAVSPERIVSQTPEPADFDLFWEKSLKRYYREVPLDVAIRPYAPWTNGSREAFEISFGVPGGQRVYGWLVKPKGLKGKAPVFVQVPGAGFGWWSFEPKLDLADRGGIVLFMSVLRLPLSGGFDTYLRTGEVWSKQLKWCEPLSNGRYCNAGADSREGYFYYRSVLGIVRAVDWLYAQPEVDQTRFYYEGTSQGGGFGLILCALFPHFTRASIFVPAMTGLYERQSGMQAGWPQPIENARRYAPERTRAVRKVMAYYDGVNFAKRIRCPIDMAVGFVDQTCAPNAVYGAYNALRTTDKRIVHGLGMGHGVYPWIYQLLSTESYDRKRPHGAQ
ncbi:MAG: acetylxylan esterase [Kiritimatiellia bacterium]